MSYLSLNNYFRAAGAFGSTLTPLIVANVAGADYLVPIFAIALCQLIMILPPILNKKLPETYEEAVKLKDGSTLCCTY